MIGIVGGIGPYAGLDLLRKVFDNTIAGKDQDHIDAILLSMPSSILDRTEYLVGKVKENPGLAIAEVVKRLEMAGAMVAGIPCNTAHVSDIFQPILDELLMEGCRINVLHMIHETVSFLAGTFPKIKRIGVLSTTGTYLNSVYKDALEAKGYEVFRPRSEMQEQLIHPAIYHPEYGIKSVSNPVQSRAKNNLLEGFSYLKERGAEAVILGCTEIPIAFPEKNIEGMIAIDPTTVLARALIQYDTPEKLTPYFE
jgi:aspartate racemase